MMIQDKKVKCHHCDRHIGNKHKNLSSQSSTIVPVHKSVITKAIAVPRTIYPMSAHESSELKVVMKIQLLCGGCSHHTTTEIDVTEYSL